MSVLFRPYRDITTAPTPRSREDETFYAWLLDVLGVPITIDASVDYEDWMEPAQMLASFIRLGVDILILPRQRLSLARQEPLFHIPGIACPDILVGRLTNVDSLTEEAKGLVWPPRGLDVALAIHYPALETFRTRAGRDYQVCDMPGDGSDSEDPVSQDPAETLCMFAGRSVLLKQFVPVKAHALIPLTVPEDLTPRQARLMLQNAFSWHLMQHGGRRAALMIQEDIPIGFEMRFFVIGGQVTTAAGCIEAFTPAQRICRQDYRLEEIRGDGNPEHQVEAVDTLRTFAAEFIAALAIEKPNLRNYVLDVGLNLDTGAPLAIELNTIGDAGLYAANTDLLARAILRETGVFLPEVSELHPLPLE